MSHVCPDGAGHGGIILDVPTHHVCVGGYRKKSLLPQLKGCARLLSGDRAPSAGLFRFYLYFSRAGVLTLENDGLAHDKIQTLFYAKRTFHPHARRRQGHTQEDKSLGQPAVEMLQAPAWAMHGTVHELAHSSFLPIPSPPPRWQIVLPDRLAGRG